MASICGVRGLVVGVGVAMLPCAAPGDFGFDDIEFWVGEGASQAAFVVDLADGGPPLAWGFRWDGEAAGFDMFVAVLAADPDLYARIGEEGQFGIPVFGFGHDVDSDGFSLTDGTAFTDGIGVTAPSDDALATDADDRYVEGWAVNGFWGYWAGTGDPYAGGSWGFAPVGMIDRVLADGDWDGWAFAPGFDGDAPGEPIAALPPATCPADLDDNGAIDSADLNLLLASFGCVDCDDVDGDGAVTSGDLNLLLQDFGAVCD